MVVLGMHVRADLDPIVMQQGMWQVGQALIGNGRGPKTSRIHPHLSAHLT